jgi:hypothetical protein
MRTRVFVSYSHIDREWMDRLQMHLAVLERRGLVDVWSDRRIEVGAGWEEEIEAALTGARVAVLLVSPAYLASSFVWDHEMRRIMAHQKDGMRVLPLLARPCAWRLAEELVRLQARPADGRPLSTGSEAQIDLDLAAFVYELAGIVGAMPNAVAAHEWERMAITPEPLSGDTAILTRLGMALRTVGTYMLPALWHGEYSATRVRLTLRIARQAGPDFAGTLEYDHGGVTEISGRINTDTHTLRDDPRWRGLGGWSDLALVFREVRVVREGQRPFTLDGEYRAFVDRRRMFGGWFSQDALVGTFSFVAEDEMVAT